MSIESDIATAIVTVVSTVTELKSVSFDTIFLSNADFRDSELPAVQIWDVAQSIEHARGQAKVTWSISLELIMKSLTTGSVTQQDLWELRRKIQLALWNQPNLGIPGVVHMIYTGNITDLHTVQPFYIARLDFDVLYYDDLVSTC